MARVKKSDLDLHGLLILAAPRGPEGDRRIRNLSAALGIARYSIYKWIRNDRIPAIRAKQVAEQSEGRVRVRDFDDYVYKD